MPEAFYTREGPWFLPTDLTRGPWSAEHQHAGPPAALVARAMEQLEPALPVARFTMEILRPIELGRLEIHANIIRETRRTQFVEATLADDDGELALAAAWRVRGEAVETALEPLPHPLPADSGEAAFWEPPWGASYFSATEWRLAAGDLATAGPAAVWIRMRVPLIEGEEPSPLARVLVAADSGNGISAVLSFQDHLFVNTDLTVHLPRPPGGEWVLLDAETRVGPGGIGLAESRLWDERGLIGRGAQTLLVAPRHNQGEDR